MTIAASLESPEGQRLIDKVAQTFNVDDDKAGQAVHALTDELQARIQRSMLNRAGVADVAALVTNSTAGVALSDPSALASPDGIESGNHILDVLIGNKHVSRKIAARTAYRSGVDAGTVEKMLPAVASLLIAELQRQAQPALAKVVSSVPGLISAGGSPLPLPGDMLPPVGSSNWAPGNERPAPRTSPGDPIDPGQPLPIPGDNIPGLGRKSGRPYAQPDEDDPYQRLPDIIRRGGQQVPGDSGGSLDDIIRSIFGKVLGSNRGVIGTMIQLFLIRWLASLARRILSRAFAGR
ncbi:DUF937 domain-containing protein [Hyphomicrobium denitrificans]|nr:DUF937 domain-containing protein [Hyphomicrobium denitrificans]